MKIAYIEKVFRRDSLEMIAVINDIITDYQAQGYTLTLRQLYYQLVARDYIANSEQSYKRVGNVVSDGRLAGLIDWTAIEDRTRAVEIASSWARPDSILRSAERSYRRDLWENQPVYMEVWVEKEALAGVVARACERRRVSYFSCRGYVSQSEMFNAAQRLLDYVGKPGGVRIIHLGDHDPSGIDMSRDIQARLQLMMGEGYSQVDFQRIALNYAQIEQYQPPPNPAKATDSRFEDYRARFGSRSWELDALDPSVLVELIGAAVEPGLDPVQWESDQAQEAQERSLLGLIASNYQPVVDYLESE